MDAYNTFQLQKMEAVQSLPQDVTMGFDFTRERRVHIIQWQFTQLLDDARDFGPLWGKESWYLAIGAANQYDPCHQSIS